MADNEAVTVSKEMAVTHADFFRSLPNAVDGAPYEVSGTKVTVGESDARRLEIELGPEGERRIALLSVPATPVTLRFFGYSDSERAAALEAFDRGFQRGGG